MRAFFSPQQGRISFHFILIALIGFVIGTALYQHFNTPITINAQLNKSLVSTTILTQRKDLKDIKFITHEGKNFTRNDFFGKWSILFFGFTHCPDICPSTLHTMQKVKNNLEKSKLWESFQMYMITVDPERDTTEVLANYVPFYDKEFIGLRANINDTQIFARHLGILSIKQESANNNYNVDHSAAMILVNPKGEMTGIISAPHDTKKIAQDLTILAQYIKKIGIKSSLKKSTENTPTPKNPTPKGALEFSQKWIRAAPKNSNTLAAYTQITNTQDSDITIDHISSDDFEDVMLHETRIEKNIASMQHIKALTIPKSETLTLKPMGKHIMLISPERPLKANDNVELRFHTKDGRSFQETFLIQHNAPNN